MIWASHIFRGGKRCSQCTSIRINLGNARKQGIVIKLVPGNHQALQAFCQEAQKTGHKLFYAGESAGVVAYRYMLMLTVRKRETIPEDTATALMELQGNRCGACGDLLRKFEKHHKKPFSAGGTDDINNLVLLCPACHASETEKQEQAACRNNVWFESHLPPTHAQCIRVSTATNTNPLGRRDSAAPRK